MAQQFSEETRDLLDRANRAIAAAIKTREECREILSRAASGPLASAAFGSEPAASRTVNRLTSRQPFLNRRPVPFPYES